MKYLLEHKYIKNFKVKKGLVSYAFMFGKTLFGKYVNSFFSAKKLQDLYNITEDERYSKKNCSPTRATRRARIVWKPTSDTQLKHEHSGAHQ